MSFLNQFRNRAVAMPHSKNAHARVAAKDTKIISSTDASNTDGLVERITDYEWLTRDRYQSLLNPALNCASSPVVIPGGKGINSRSASGQLYALKRNTVLQRLPFVLLTTLCVDSP